MSTSSKRHTLTDGERELLQAPFLATVSTLRQDGSIHAIPTWVDVDGDDVLLNSEVTRAWAKNATERNEMSIVVRDPDNAYRWVSISGRVSDADTDTAFAQADRLAQKYLGQPTYPNHRPGDVRVLLRVRPERVISSGT